MVKLIKWMMVLFIPLISLTLTSCEDDDKDEPIINDPQKHIVGKWICDEDAFGDPWEEPLVFVFDANGTGYGWFQEEPYSNRWVFTYTISETKIKFKEYDEYNDEWDTYSLRYELSNNGKSLVIYGYDDNDMSILRFKKN